MTSYRLRTTASSPSGNESHGFKGLLFTQCRCSSAPSHSKTREIWNIVPALEDEAVGNLKTAFFYRGLIFYFIPLVRKEIHITMLNLPRIISPAPLWFHCNKMLQLWAVFVFISVLLKISPFLCTGTVVFCLSISCHEEDLCSAKQGSNLVKKKYLWSTILENRCQWREWPS